MSYVEYRARKTLQNASLVQNFALPDPVPIDLVKQRSEADPEPLGCRTTIALGRLQGLDNGLAFSALNDVAQRAGLTP